MNYPRLHLPEADLTILVKEDKPKVFCLVRKKWIILTPEEWVRQNFISYLTHQLRPISATAPKPATAKATHFSVSAVSDAPPVPMLFTVPSACVIACPDQYC